MLCVCVGDVMDVVFSVFCCTLLSCRMLIVVIMGKWSDDSAC